MRKTLPTIARVLLSTSLILIYTINAQSQPQLAYQPVINAGLTEPIEVKTAPGDVSGRLFIVQKGGTILIWNGASLLATPFLDISSIIVSDGERGLLSMAFHPQYQSNGFFFVYYNNTAGSVTVARYQVSANPDIADPSPNPASPLITIPKNYTNHNGGHLQFKTEGAVNYLYFATGDGGSGNDPDNNAQNPASYLGKMIRMDVDAATPTPEIWAWGLRNPFRWSFDRTTGDIWIGDVGQGLKEEIDFRAGGSGGANYGWPCFEAALVNTSAPPAGDCDSVGTVDVLPIHDYDNPPSGSSSVIGGYVYRGTEFPSLQGYYMTADFYSGQLWLITPDGMGGWTISTQTGLAAFIASFSETDDGSVIYAVGLGTNTIYKLIVPAVTPLSLISFSGKAGSGYNDLSWTTVAEENIDRYLIEYSEDGSNYNPAGQVASVNSNDRHDYSFRHTINSTGKIFYRLRVNELDGRYHYSPVIIIRNNNHLPVKVYPTIVSNRLVNIITSEEIETITLSTATGQPVMIKNSAGLTGYFTLSLPALRPGIYFLRIRGKNFQQAEKIIIRE